MAYGLGWQFGVIDGVRDVGHGGSQQGTSAMILIAPDARAGAVVLINSDTGGASELATRILRIVLGLPEPEHKEITVDPKLYDGYIGTYQVGDFSMTVSREDGRLLAQVRDQQIPLLPETARDYVLKGTDVQIIFQTDGNGRAKQLVLRESGTDSYLNRIK